jgi:outer membrane biosynthesis protein TonB
VEGFMTEGLFVLTIIFVAYIVYVTINDNKKSSKSETQKAKDITPTKTIPAEATKTAVKPAVKTAKPTIKKEPVIAEPIKAKKASPEATKATPKPSVKTAAKPVEKPKPTTVATKATATPPAEKKGLLNPLTGEVTTSYNNYRFTKRWIKDALVAEGLVSKVYTNTELNADIETTIKNALVKLEAIDKYKP